MDRPLPAPDDALYWFLGNVVGIPAFILFGFASLVSLFQWIRFLAGVRTKAAPITAGFLKFTLQQIGNFPSYVNGTLLLLATQLPVVALSYLGVQFSVAFDGSSIRGSSNFQFWEAMRPVLFYDHWTPTAQLAVKLAVGFLLLINLTTMVVGEATWFAWAAAPMFALAVIVFIGGCSAGFLASTGEAGYGVQMLWVYITAIVILCMWGAAIIVACFASSAVMLMLSGNEQAAS